MPPALSRRFLLIDSLRSVEETRRLLRETGPRYLVVVIREAPDYYLLRARDFDGRVADAAGHAQLQDTGLLRGLDPVPERTHTDAGEGRTPCLVLEDGILVGVFDPELQGSRHTSTRVLFPGKDPRSSTRAPDGTPELVRYVSAAMPGEAALGEAVVLAVEVGTTASPLRVELAEGSELDVVVQARTGFTLEGDRTGTLRVPEAGASERIEFRLRAGAAGVGRVLVYAFLEGRFLGSLTLRPVVHPASGVGPAPLISETGVLHGASLPAAADLSLLILEEEEKGEPVLSIRVTARDAGLGLNLKEFGPVSLRMNPQAFFNDFFADIEALGHLDPDSAEMVRRKLQGKGTTLFESIFPPELQKELWNLRHRIASIQIHSEESWIPWELCFLTGDLDGVTVPGGFFCEAFEVTRWIPEIPCHPHLTLNNVALVVPRDSRLGGVQEERSFLLSLAGGERSVEEVPARFLDVSRALSEGRFDAFHFAGHGVARAPDPDRSAILLEKPDRPRARPEELRPEEINGELKNLGRSKPIIFLNSCHGARGALTITGAGGWAQRYLRAGAGAFIGAYWSVTDTAASSFSKAFYREIRAGKTLGAAVRAARLAIRSSGDPTWLAYTVYADPSAAVDG